MASVHYVKLTNQGGYVVRLQFVYIDSCGNKVRTSGTGDITAGRSQEADPGRFGVPVGATFFVYADVVAGTDRVSCESFEYCNEGTLGASFTTTRGTLNSKLTFSGYYHHSGPSAVDDSIIVIQEDEFQELRSCDEGEEIIVINSN